MRGRFRYCVICFIMITLLCLNGCRGATNITSAVWGIDTGRKQMHDYDSPYTVCYQNPDKTYSFYIYASPIQYQQNPKSGYKLIDSSLRKSSKGVFSLENKSNSIKTYFPSDLSQELLISDGKNSLWISPDDINNCGKIEKIDYTNLYGDLVQAALYAGEQIDYVFYPEKTGIRLEIILKERPRDKLSFKTHTAAKVLENKHNGYVVFSQKSWEGETEKTAVVYGPLGRSGNGRLHIGGDIQTQMDDEMCTMVFEPEAELLDGSYLVKLDVSFELYRNKIPDTAVYENQPVNAYLSDYAVVGKHPQLGEGWLYLRFRMSEVMAIHSDHILNASYNTRCLENRANKNFNLGYMNDQWSSGGMVWTTKMTASSPVENCFTNRTQFKISVDILDFAKKAFDDPSWFTESKGMVVKGGDIDGYDMIATSDNALYTPYVCVTLDKLPSCFDPIQNDGR